MSGIPSTSTQRWEEFLIDKDVIVMTKSTFFRTVNYLFQFAEAPSRHTWEFYHYRPWEYILATWCTTLDIDACALSCGAQHPFILRDGETLRYALPDYVLMSLGLNAEGKQEGWLLLVVEIKPLRKPEPDTELGRQDARFTFHKAWKQRTNQARLALQTHPAQEEVHIMMVAGPWFAFYVYERADLLLPVPNAPSLAESPPRKRSRKTRRDMPRYTDPDNFAPGRDPVDPPANRPIEIRDTIETVSVEDRNVPRRSVRFTKAKRKREVELTADPYVPAPAVNHVFQLSQNGKRSALNPWFLRGLSQMKEKLVKRSQGTFRPQNSWFDCLPDIRPEGDGHEEGFVLPAIEDPPPPINQDVVREVERVDEDPDMVGIPATPASKMRGAFNTTQVNAMMSPRINRTSGAFGSGAEHPARSSQAVPGGSTDSEGTLSHKHPETQSSDSDSESDNDTTPKGQRGRQSQGLTSQHSTRESSPSDDYLERRQHSPPRHPQLYSVLPDSSPLHFTPHKQLFGDRMTDEDGSELLTTYDSPDPGSEAIARPASTSLGPSSSSSRPPHDTTHGDAPSHSIQPPLSDHVQQDYAGILPGTPVAPPSHSMPPSRKVNYVLAPKFRGKPPSRRMTERMGDPATSTGLRFMATQEEWRRQGPIDDELWMIVMKASREGVTDRHQAFRNAGMSENMAYTAYQRHYDVYIRKIQGSSNGSGSSSSSSNNTAALAAPPIHLQQRRATDSSNTGPHPGQLPRSSVATGQPPKPRGNGASRSRPPPASGSVARTTGRTAGRNESHSESSNSDFPDDASGSAARRPANDAQMNRLAEGVGNLDVASVPGGGGNSGRGTDPPREGLGGFEELTLERRMQLLRERGMDVDQAKAAHARYDKAFDGKNLDRRDQFDSFIRFDDAATARTTATSVAPLQRQRRAPARSDAHALPGPSNQAREETTGSQETDAAFALQGSNPEPEQPRTDTSRKGKEKQR